MRKIAVERFCIQVPRITHLVIALASIYASGLALGADNNPPARALNNTSAYDIIPEESHEFFGNLAEQNARAAQ